MLGRWHWLVGVVVVASASTALGQDESEPTEAAEPPAVDATEEGSIGEPMAPATEAPRRNVVRDREVEVSAEAGAAGEAPAPSGPMVGRMPTLFGPTGIFSIITADSTPPGTFALSLSGEFSTGSDVVRAGDDNVLFGGQLGLSYTPQRNVELFANLSARGNSSNFSDPSLIQSVGDLRFGAKGFGPLADGLSAGGAVTAVLLNGADDIGYDFSATSIDIRALLSYDLLQARNIPLALHLNLGFYLDNSDRLFDFELQRVERFAHQVSDFNSFDIGLGVEVPLAYVTPFLEWNLGVPVGSGDEQACATNPIPCPTDAGISTFPQVLTVGAKVAPIESLAINLGVDFGLTSEEATGLPGVPPYNVMFGLAYVIDPSPEPTVVTDALPAGPTGYILGEVVDDGTGEVVGGALVRYPETEFTPQSSDPDTGRFRSYEFPVETMVQVEVSHPRYQSREFARTIIEGEDGIRIRMRPRLDLSILTGRVLDSAGNPLPATIYVAGPESLEIEADPLTSEFEQQLPVGRYVLTIVAADHISSRQAVELTSGQVPLEVSLQRLPPDQRAVLRGDRIEIEGARVAFVDNGLELEADSQTIVEQVAALLGQHPEIQLRVMAHSDSEGTVEQTNLQAGAVVDYLVGVGIDPARLTAEGVGGERPQFPNISERNRQRNWRVEFLFD